MLTLILRKVLVVVLFSFLMLELASVIFGPDIQSHRLAYLLQGLGIVCTGFMVYMYLTLFREPLYSEPSIWRKLRLLATVLIALRVVAIFWFLSNLDLQDIQQGNTAFSLDNSISGLVIGLMYGRDWRFRLINGVVWMQGLKSIDWAIVSVRSVFLG